MRGNDDGGKWNVYFCGYELCRSFSIVEQKMDDFTYLKSQKSSSKLVLLLQREIWSMCRSWLNPQKKVWRSHTPKNTGSPTFWFEWYHNFISMAPLKAIILLRPWQSEIWLLRLAWNSHKKRLEKPCPKRCWKAAILFCITGKFWPLPRVPLQNLDKLVSKWNCWAILDIKLCSHSTVDD